MYRLAFIYVFDIVWHFMITVQCPEAVFQWWVQSGDSWTSCRCSQCSVNKGGPYTWQHIVQYIWEHIIYYENKLSRAICSWQHIIIKYDAWNWYISKRKNLHVLRQFYIFRSINCVIWPSFSETWSKCFLKHWAQKSWEHKRTKHVNYVWIYFLCNNKCFNKCLINVFITAWSINVLIYAR